jgi:hypothetical protein
MKTDGRTDTRTEVHEKGNRSLLRLCERTETFMDVKRLFALITVNIFTKLLVIFSSCMHP